MRLDLLLEQIEVVSVCGDTSRIALRVSEDSRDVDWQTVFVAVEGAAADGHRFAEGLDCALVVAERDVAPAEGVPLVIVRDSRKALAALAATLEGNPSHSLSVVGITGTNGKTTTSWILESILAAAGRRVGVIGTTGHRLFGESLPTRFTTPPAPQWQGLIRQMRDRGCEFLVSEVSSIALDARRVDRTRFEIGVFTNLSRDHLDYHGSMEAYAASKVLLFSEHLAESGHAVVPERCPVLDAVLEARADLRVWRYGLEGGDVYPRDLEMTATGSLGRILTPSGAFDLELPLLGEHNVLNALGAAAAALSAGISLEAIERGLRQVPVIPGRMEPVVAADGPTVLVDYAHTPDALSHALEGLRPLTAGRLMVVFGCGGDRDVGKRPEMGRVACEKADWVCVTTDNPRSEDPAKILEDIRVGLNEQALVVSDRRLAIQKAIEEAAAGDVVLIAGKGHEQYQEVDGVQLPFDDRAVAAAALGEGV